MATMCDFLRAYESYKAFGEATLAIVPANIKKLKHTEYCRPDGRIRIKLKKHFLLILSKSNSAHYFQNKRENN